MSLLSHQRAWLWPLFWPVGLLLLLSGCATTATVPSQSVAPMLRSAMPAVANITTEGGMAGRTLPESTDPVLRRLLEELPLNSGSGVIIDAEQGLLVTNQHVIDDAERIVVTLHDRRRLPAEVVGVDPEADIALLRIEASNLRALPFADSSRLRVGDFVVAIGNPFGLGQTATLGMISALGRSGLGIEGFEDFIQTDASINPGNSGGPLVNLRGEMVGVNTAILTPGGGNIGINFAIPSNMVQRLSEDLLRHGEVQRGQLGLSVRDLTPNLASEMGLDWYGGALVMRVIDNSAAYRAGLQRGDVILMLDQRPIDNADALRNAVGLQRVGDEVMLGLLRNGEPVVLRVTIEAR